MKYLTVNGRKVACPFDDLLRDLTPLEFANLIASVEADKEILVEIQTYISAEWGEALIDGHNRARVAAAKGMEIRVYCRGKMTEEAARQKALALNVPRRHLTPAEQTAQAQKRQARVTVLTGEGASQRAIAAELGVSRTQVQRDQAAGKVPGDSKVAPTEPKTEPTEPRGPGGPRDSVAPGDATEKPPTVTGLDGKKYPAAAARLRPKVRRIAAATRLLNQTRSLESALRKFTGSASNAQRAATLATARGIPLTEDGRTCTWLAELAAWFKDLEPGAQA